MKFTQLSVVVAIAATGMILFLLTLQQPGAAPEVQFVTLKGEKLATSDLRGKVVLVNFWATDCTTCMHEMPQLIETYKKFAPQGFETIAVAMSYDPPNYVLNYAEKNALPFKVALDVKGDIAKRFGDIRLTPTSFLIDKQGRIVKQYLGEPDFAAFQALVAQKLKEAA